jgi:nitrite reductase (NO-forming)
MKTTKMPTKLHPHPKNRLLEPFAARPVIHFVIAAAFLLIATPVPLLACDACNIAFANEILKERADTPAGRDMLAAMQRQANMNLPGMGSPMVAAIIAQATPGVIPPAEEHPFPAVAIDNPVRTAAPKLPVPSRAAAQGGRPVPDYFEGFEFLDIIERDYALDSAPYSTVPQDAPVDKAFSIRMHEGKTYIGNGVVYEGFLMDGKIPGPTIIVDQGDVVEMSFVNEGKIPHGASIHAAYTQTSKYVGKIEPGQTKSVRFRAMTPGVFMYHCAPGGHAIGMHVIGGQYGMIMVRPPSGSYRMEQELGHKPNLELYMIQHELYSAGKHSIDGNPQYVMFNGRTFRYVEEPILTRPGDYVRINFLNVGPNILSTFHIVGIVWDHIYWQGHPEARLPGGQSVTAGPTDSFVIEFRMPPDEGAYTMLTHAVGSTNRGAIGLLVVDSKAKLEPHRTVLADGPSFNDGEMRGYVSGATRVISPFGLGTHPDDRPVVYGPEIKEVFVSIIGNSYYPKAIQIAPGTRVTWTNEDVFTYMAGEYAGVHNAAAINTPDHLDGFSGALLAHGETFSHVFDDEFEWLYHCTPHPYMLGKIIVKQPEVDLAALAKAGAGAKGSIGPGSIGLIALCLLFSSLALVRSRERNGAP